MQETTDPEMAKINHLPLKYLDPVQDLFSKTPKQVLFENVLEDILESEKDLPNDPGTLIPLVEDMLREIPEAYSSDYTATPQDERLGKIIKMPDNKLRRIITKVLVTRLWNTLDHPPLSHVGDRYLYHQPRDLQDINTMYRQPDGSYNNIMNPDLGKARSIYAKTVNPELTLPTTDRPDPGLLFDLLMARGDGFRPNEAGFSSLFFCHATIITHDIFHTNRENSNINNASSYLDLSSLYGNSQEEQDSIRTFSNGEVKPDTFFDKRILGLPPVVSVMLIMYSRFHNHAAKTLAAINEGGRFTLPPNADEAAKKKRDNDLFQVARLVTNGLYVNICVNDYVRAIFNVNNSISNWSLNPQAEITKLSGKKLPRGVGGQVSCEFNLLYRFHSALSQGDANWTERFFQEMFPNQDISKLSLEEFLRGIGKYENSIPKEPSERTFGGLTRKEDGTFDDKGLVKILKEAIEDPAGAFGANHVPDSLKLVEVMGILQARRWQVASLNEFRRFMGQKPHTTFEEINPDPYVADTLRTLYNHPDNVEMYPGFFVEQTTPRQDPGSGIGAPVTVTGAVLADAVNLIRGDRHMTLDYKSAALTNWGIKEVASDSQTLGGAKIYHLILNAFPNWFKFNSIYAMQPFYTPSAGSEIFERLEEKHGLEVKRLYSFNQPELFSQPVPVTAHAAVKHILEDQTNFKVPWAESGFLLTYMLSGDSPAHAEQRELVGNTLHAGGGDAIQQFTDFAKLITLSLLKKGVSPLGKQSVYHIDIIKDFGNIVTLHFASVLCYLPLKFEFNPQGTYTETELFQVFTKLIDYIFYNVDPTKTWALRRNLNEAFPKLTTAIKEKVQALKTQAADQSSLQCPVIGQQPGENDTASAIRTYGATFTRQILSAGTNIEETTEILIGNGIAIIGTVGLVFGQLIDFYLQPENASYWAHIIELSADGSTEANEKLIKYILEATRLSGAMGSVRNVDPADGKPIELVVDQSGRKIALNKGDRVITSFAHASRDPTVFPNPNAVDIERPAELYVAFGFGPHKCLGRTIGTACLLTMLKAVAGLKNLRRMPGTQGQLRLVTRSNGSRQYLTPDSSEFTIFPTTMKLLFDKPV